MSRNTANKSVTLTASSLVKTGAGRIVGMYVISTTSGTIKLWNNTSATGDFKYDTMTPAVGYHPLGDVGFDVGLYATIGGTLKVTLVYE